MVKQKTTFYLTIIIIIILFDFIASYLSKFFEFDYTNLAVLSMCLYFISGYIGCKFFRLSHGVLAGFTVGLTDSTIGWFLSDKIGAYIPFEQPEYSLSLIIEIIFLVSLEAAFLGLIGGLFYLVLESLRNKNLINR